MLHKAFEKVWENTFFDRMKIFWRAVLVNAVSIGTKADIPESIVYEVETEVFDSFSIIFEVKLLDLLLCHLVT